MTTNRNAKQINKYLRSDFHSLFFTYITNLYFSITCACTKIPSFTLLSNLLTTCIRKLEQAIINRRSISNL